MSDTRDNGRDPFEERKVEGFGTFQPGDPETGRYEDLSIHPAESASALDPEALKETIAAQIEAAQRVIDNWSSGDLAGAVNALGEVTEVARASLTDFAPAPNVEPDRAAVEHVAMTPEQAAHGLALRELQSESREEMEQLHDAGTALAARGAELDYRHMPEVEIDRAAIPNIETHETRGNSFSATLFAEHASHVMDFVLETVTVATEPLLRPSPAATRLAEHASRVMDIVLETVTASTESLWRPSPAELHDLMRARDEQTETRAIVAADRQHAAALDEANWHINHNRNHARTDDGARQAEDVFDRYPGVTQDPGADETRARENDRAFYDTGIERER